MNKKIYIRLGKTDKGLRKISASFKPNYKPFDNGYYNKKYFPTIAFALNLDIDDDAFKQAEEVIGNINLSKQQTKVCAEVGEIEETTEDKSKALEDEDAI